MKVVTQAPNPEQAMLNGILNRSSVTKIQPDEPPRELIEQLLSTAVMAPNHHLNQPWRFIVLTGQAREALGEVLAQRVRMSEADPDTPEALGRQQAERLKPLRAPVVVVVAAVKDDHPHAMEIENIAATAACAEHILLAAPALGLGAFWRTGDAAYSPEVKRYLGLSESDNIVAILYVGYPAASRAPLARVSAAEKTTWLTGGA
jgi:nitroreductase